VIIAPCGHCHYAVSSTPYGHCHSAVYIAPYVQHHSAVFSAPYGQCHSAVFSAPYDHCHSAVFSAPYGHCHSAVFIAPYGHCHSSPYRRFAAVMNVPSPRTASRQNNTAASHSYHFNTVLYPVSYSECQLPLNPTVVTSEVLLPQPEITATFSQSNITFTGTPADLSTYIYNAI
jgi:hypothetical protein